MFAWKACSTCSMRWGKMQWKKLLTAGFIVSTWKGVYLLTYKKVTHSFFDFWFFNNVCHFHCLLWSNLKSIFLSFLIVIWDLWMLIRSICDKYLLCFSSLLQYQNLKNYFANGVFCSLSVKQRHIRPSGNFWNFFTQSDSQM